MATPHPASDPLVCVLCISFAELTHEFLQILEKTPNRLKRIRNWRVRISSIGLLSAALAQSPVCPASELCVFSNINSAQGRDPSILGVNKTSFLFSLVLNKLGDNLAFFS